MKILDENKLKNMADYINGYIRTHNGDSPKFGEILEYISLLMLWERSSIPTR